jgi:Uma2 family endonuclease
MKISVMITSLEQLDQTKQYSYADYLTWEFAERIELLKGYFRQMAAPSTFHQRISRNLTRQIGNFFHKSPCQLFVAPFDVRLYSPKKSWLADKDIYTVVQPDLCVICDKNKIDERGCLGAPDFIIEILSATNSKTDLKDKFELYREAGVIEYWIVYPNDKILHQFVLEDEKYQLKGIYTRTESASPQLFPALVVDLADIFEEN